LARIDDTWWPFESHSIGGEKTESAGDLVREKALVAGNVVREQAEKAEQAVEHPGPQRC